MKNNVLWMFILVTVSLIVDWIMKKIMPGCALFAAAVILCGAENTAKPPEISRAVVFQNGVSAVTALLDSGSKKVFYVSPEAVPQYGTLWFAPEVVSAKKVLLPEVKKVFFPISNITYNYAGKMVSLTVRDQNERVRTVAGRVINPDPAYDPADEKADLPQLKEDSVCLQSSDGKNFTVFDRAAVVAVESAASPERRIYRIQKIKKPHWQIELKNIQKAPVAADYLTSGISWNGAGRITLLDSGKLKLDLACEISNGIADFKDVDFALASGKANLHYAGRISPMALTEKNISSPAQGYKRTRSFAAAASYSDSAAVGNSFHTATGESEDMHIFPIGRISLKKGEVLYKKLISAECAFERLVVWDTKPVTDVYARRRGAVKTEPMDALRFTNPLDMPIPSVPLEIVDGNIVQAQVSGKWVNRKEKCAIEIMPAQTISANAAEYEMPYTPNPELEQRFSDISRNKHGKFIGGIIAGTSYRLSDVIGTLKIKNFRKSAAKMVITANYFGFPVSADGKPEMIKLDNDFAVNDRYQLKWEITLAPGEEKKLEYRYSTLLR